MRAEFAAGTTYDGATPALTAATPLTPGMHSLYLSIFDQGDHVYDSAVFVDNLRVGRVGNVRRTASRAPNRSANRELYGLGDSYSSGFGVSPYEPGTHQDAGRTTASAPRARSRRWWLTTSAAGTAFPRVPGRRDQGLLRAAQLDLGRDGATRLPEIRRRTRDVHDRRQRRAFRRHSARLHRRRGAAAVQHVSWRRQRHRRGGRVVRAPGRADRDPGRIYPYDEVNGAVRERTPSAAHVAVGYPPFFTARAATARSCRVAAAKPSRRQTNGGWSNRSPSSTGSSSATRCATGSSSSTRRRGSSATSSAVRTTSGSTRCSRAGASTPRPTATGRSPTRSEQIGHV